MKIALILLTLNEYDCLKKIFPRVLESCSPDLLDAIYAIDGGSTDGSIEYYQQYNIPIIAQSHRSRGAAFHLALEKISADAYIFFSPDGNEDPNDLFKFRKWANNAFNLIANVFFNRSGKYLTDSINGYRAITKTAMEKLSLDAMDYTIEF